MVRGRSEDGPIYAVEREIEDVVPVVDSVGELVHLLGTSYGAICALEAARLTPHIAKLSSTSRRLSTPSPHPASSMNSCCGC